MNVASKNPQYNEKEIEKNISSQAQKVHKKKQPLIKKDKKKVDFDSADYFIEGNTKKPDLRRESMFDF